MYGYGNPGRQDDGIGPAVVREIDREIEQGLFTLADTDANYQLGIEDAAGIGGYDLVLFVDTAVDQASCFTARKVEPGTEIAFTSHFVKPESVLAMCEDLYGSTPNTWIIGVRGYSFDYAEGLTPRAERNFSQALGFITLLLRVHEGRTMAKEEKTVLIIDDDADIRASMRIVLEAAGFSVGEAGDGEEGLKVAEKVNPDAVIVDLMMETVDAGSKVSTKLKETGFKGPIYLLSSAGDTVRYNIDAKELGLAGIFQKPINHDVLISTLKRRLNME